MVVESIMHFMNWDAVWYAHPGSVKGAILWSGRYHVGIWTGPDNDLVCIRSVSSSQAAEAALSPGGHTILTATLKALWLKFRGGHKVCPECRKREKR